MVELTKKVMKAVIKNRTYREESLITLFCEIKAMLNSIPLLPCSNDPSDFDELTSNNFIIKKFVNFAPVDFNEDHISSREKLKSVQSYSFEIWIKYIKRVYYVTKQTKKVVQRSNKKFRSWRSSANTLKQHTTITLAPRLNHQSFSFKRQFCAIGWGETTQWFNDSSYSIIMLAGKVKLNPTPYEKGGVLTRK